MRIRHYFSHLSINSASASYDVRQGFDKQFCVDFIDQDCDVDHSNNTTSSSHNINSNNRDRKCQTAPRKPCRPSLGGGGTSSTSGQNSVSSQQQPRSSSVPTLVTNNSENSKVYIYCLNIYDKILGKFWNVFAQSLLPMTKVMRKFFFCIKIPWLKFLNQKRKSY